MKKLLEPYILIPALIVVIVLGVIIIGSANYDPETHGHSHDQSHGHEH